MSEEASNSNLACHYEALDLLVTVDEICKGFQSQLTQVQKQIDQVMERQQKHLKSQAHILERLLAKNGLEVNDKQTQTDPIVEVTY